jgi:hypothetical protein
LNKGILNYRAILIAILTIWLLGLFVGIFAPADVLSSTPFLQEYVSAISFISNPKGLIAARSTFPEVSALYHATVIWSLPLWILLSWKWMSDQLKTNKTDMLFKPTLTIGNKFLLILLLPIWLLLTYAGFSLNHGGDTRIFAFGTSRMQLAIFGMALQICIAITFSIAIFSVKRLIK